MSVTTIIPWLTQNDLILPGKYEAQTWKSKSGWVNNLENHYSSISLTTEGSLNSSLVVGIIRGRPSDEVSAVGFIVFQVIKRPIIGFPIHKCRPNGFVSHRLLPLRG